LLRHIKAAGHRAFLIADRWANAAFTPAWNPLYYLGTLAFFFFYVVFVSGIYIYIFYETSVEHAYTSVEYLTREQWYAGGVMRSLHRYASDAMIVTMVLHLLRGFFTDRYRGARWFSWSTGVPMFVFVFILGLSGYWLVWDKLGQFIAVRTLEWIDWLPIIAEPTARNFLTNTSVTNLFFRLLVVIHLGLSLFLVGAMLFHVNRLNEAKINPPLGLAVGTILSLLVLSLIKPVFSHAPGDLNTVPTILHLDWFYMFIYPLMDDWSMGTIWALVAGSIFLLLLLPWLPPIRREHAAEVYLDDCSGCNLCVVDCPYEAIRLQPRSDGHPRFRREAMVIASHCVSCGICAASCPFSTPFRHDRELHTGIDLPHRNISHLRDATLKILSELTGETKVLVFGCDHAVDLGKLAMPGVGTISLSCAGALPPSFIDFALRQGASGVFLTGCRMGDCYHRPGNVWAEQRIQGKREPRLHRSVKRERLRCFWAASTDLKLLEKEIQVFCHDLKQLESADGARKTAPTHMEAR